MRYNILFLIAASPLALVSEISAAQTSGDAAPAKADRGTAISDMDIIVTARKRDESLIAVPASVAAVSQERLEETGIRSLDQISSLVSGLNFTSVGAQSPVISIRGNGNRTGSGGSDLAVSVFTDGVYIPRNVNLSYEPLDLARIEVIKGPQGTIYGRNTIAGAINLVNNEPTSELSGMISASLGTSSVKGDNLWNVKGVVSGSITKDDSVMLRLALQKNFRDGYVVSRDNGYRGFHDNSTQVRATAKFRATETFTGKLTFEYGRKDSAFLNQLLFLPGRVLLSNPTIPVAQVRFYGDNLYQAFNDTKPTGEQRYYRLIGQLKVETGIGTITSLSSWGDTKATDFRDIDGTELPITANLTGSQSRDFSQELRLAGDAGSLNYMAGVFYFQEKGDEINNVYFLARSLAPGRIQNRTTFVDTKSSAAFAQLDYKIVEGLTLSGGLRYSKDRKDTPFNQTVNGIGFTVERKRSWDSFDQSLSAKYEFTPDIMAYASYNSGFRAGGFNDPTAPTVIPVSFDPERVRAFEIGTKGNLLNKAVVFQLAGYLNRYRNLQINGAIADPSTPGGFIFATTNAGRSNVKGFEISFTEEPIRGFVLSQSWSYTDARIDKYTIPAGATLPDPTGLRVPRIPKHLILLSADYRTSAGPGEFKAGVQYQYTGGAPTELEPRLDPTGVRADGYLPSRQVVNAQIGYEISDWDFNLSVRNLFGEKYLNSSRQGSPSTFQFVAPGEPRTFQLTVQKNF